MPDTGAPAPRVAGTPPRSTGRTIGRTIAWVFALLVLLGTGALGTWQGLRELPGAATFWQKTVSGGVVLYGLIGLVAGAGLLRRRRWSFALAIAWALVVTYVAGVAVLSYGDASAGLGAAIPASGGAAVIGALVAWAVHVATRARATTPPADRSS